MEEQDAGVLDAEIEGGGSDNKGGKRAVLATDKLQRGKELTRSHCKRSNR